MPAECSQDSFEFGTVDGRRVVGAFDGGLITSDAGALLLGATSKTIRLVDRLAACFSDGRDAEQIEHTIATLVGQRVFGLALEEGPAFTSSRYHKIGHDAGAIERLFVTLFLEAHAAPPKRIILDLDATDDPLHGHQEGRFFHGYYDCLYERTGVKPLLPSAQSFCSTSVLIFSSRPWFPNSAARKIGQGRRVSAARRARP